ncbi:hypothetical protein HGRIS_003628 [Hohenbuehelia grisea]|uniref:Uncharacterized protein n=1 Tax=Hohenbuehelia grisea TaxID=104357 RepID=A0ABR3JG22_9AGAR
MDGDSVTVVDTPPAVELCDNPSSTAPSDTFSKAASTPLITAFLSQMQFENYDDDDEGEKKSDCPLSSGSLPTPSTPNFLNFWMQPESAFFSAGAATDRAVTIDAKVYILGETVPKRRTFAEKEVKICEITNEADEATLEACSAVVEEWPVDDEPELGATPTVIEPSTPIESVPMVISIPTAKKPSTPIARKPLGTLKPNLPSFRASLSKITKATSPKMTTTSKTPTTNVSTSSKVGTLRVPLTTPRSSSLRTLLKATTPTSTTPTMKKSATLPRSSRSLSGTSASTPKAATKAASVGKILSPRATIFSIGRSKMATPPAQGDTSPPKSRIGSSLFSTRKLSCSTTSITKSGSGNKARPTGSTPTRAMPTWR